MTDLPQPKQSAFTTEAAKKIFYIGSVVVSFLMFVQNYYINRQMDVLQHRADVREAYFNKGLIDGAKEREAAYRAAMERNQQIVAFCKKNDCGLPPELETLPPAAQFESLETILTRNREK